MPISLTKYSCGYGSTLRTKEPNKRLKSEQDIFRNTKYPLIRLQESEQRRLTTTYQISIEADRIARRFVVKGKAARRRRHAALQVSAMQNLSQCGGRGYSWWQCLACRCRCNRWKFPPNPRRGGRCCLANAAVRFLSIATSQGNGDGRRDANQQHQDYTNDNFCVETTTSLLG